MAKRDYSKFSNKQLMEELANAKASANHWTDTLHLAETIVRDRLATIQAIDAELERRKFDEIAWRSEELRH